MKEKNLQERLSKDTRYMFNSTKLLWHMDRVIARFGDGHHNKGGERVVPIHMDVGITNKCNAACNFCMTRYQGFSDSTMKKEVLTNLLKNAGETGVRSIAIIGDGEPTLNPALYNAVEIGKNAGIDIGLATNGIALNDRKISALVDNCTWIRFNLNAVEEKIYEKIMGINQWKRVKKNIERTVQLNEQRGSKCTIGLQMVTTPDSENQIIPEAQFAVDMGADYFEIKQYSKPDEGESGMIQFDLKWFEKQKIIDLLDEAQALSNEKTKIIPKWKMMQSRQKRNYDNCLDVSLLTQVSGSGKMYPCAVLFGNDKFCYGDLNKQSFKEIISSKKYWDIIDYMEKKFDVHNDCKGCCRHDSCNEFLDNYVHKKPQHINFI